MKVVSCMVVLLHVCADGSHDVKALSRVRYGHSEDRGLQQDALWQLWRVLLLPVPQGMHATRLYTAHVYTGVRFVSDKCVCMRVCVCVRLCRRCQTTITSVRAGVSYLTRK